MSKKRNRIAFCVLRLLLILSSFEQERQKRSGLLSGGRKQRRPRQGLLRAAAVLPLNLLCAKSLYHFLLKSDLIALIIFMNQSAIILKNLIRPFAAIPSEEMTSPVFSSAISRRLCITSLAIGLSRLTSLLTTVFHLPLSLS